MKSQEVNKIISKKKIPDTSGVYLFKQNKDILYIGKATSLKDRIKSYFSSDLIKSRGMLLVDMISRANNVDFLPTDSVLEAFILENELIKKHQPVFNTKEKDDKSFNYVVITKEEFPRVLVERGRNLDKENYAHVFGPYPYAPQLREALKLIRKIFPFRDTCKIGQQRPCFNYSIGLCPGVCAGKMPQKEYLKNIRHIVLFLEGKKKNLIRVLNKEMKEYAKELNFEKCSEIQKTLYSLEHIQDVSMIKKESSKNSIRIEAYDIAHMSGKNMVGVMVVLNNGEFDKNEYRKFNIQTVDGPNDTKALKEILKRRFSHTEWSFPTLVVVDGGIAQLNAAKEILPKEVGLVSIVKDSRHKAREILTSNNFEANNLKSDIVKINAEAHRFAITFHRKKRGKMPV